MAVRTTTSSATLFMAAWSYAKALQLMAPQVDAPGQHHLLSPHSLLLGFAIELGLKAVLRANGWTDQQLRGLSHDLGRIYAAVSDCGLDLSDRNGVEGLIAKMQAPHGDFLLRYIPADVEKISIPHPQQAVATVMRLLEDIEAQIESITVEMPHE